MTYLHTFKLNALSILFIALGLLVSLASFAQTVKVPIQALGIQAQAEYVQGDEAKPAVIIVHGFLTTNQFHTVVAMGKALQNIGVTTLSPTLTLGIDQRQESVKCQSIHTHTLEQDVQEIHAWVKWLQAKGHKKIVLIGHSSGSVEVLEYLNTHQDSSVVSAVFTSMFYLSGKELGTSADETNFALEALQQQKKPLKNYQLLFCKGDYLATPESYLSYSKITRPYLLSSLKKLSIPTHTIMGGADKRYQSVGENWLQDLQDSNTDLRIVEGANHFFSSEYEFDLQDHLTQILEQF